MTTVDTGLALEIEMLSPAQAAEIWKRQTKRAPNFEQYRMFIDTHGVGASWRTKVPHGATDDNEKLAKQIRYNFNEAARERTVWAAYSDNPPDSALETVVSEKGEKFARLPEPVVIRWKINSHKEQREVTNGKQKATVEVTVIDSLSGLIAATDAVQHRKPRKTTEDVSELAKAQKAPADAKKGGTFKLADGRTATMTAAGNWRAEPLNTVPMANTDASEPGNNGTASADATREPVVA